LLEVCSTLVAGMTDPKYAGMSIVIAGYQADIQNMLDKNSGLKSHFNHFLGFPNWKATYCTNFFFSRR